LLASFDEPRLSGSTRIGIVVPPEMHTRLPSAPVSSGLSQ
jgi:hypothetical protein